MAQWTRQALRDMKRIAKPQALLIREKIALLEVNPEALTNNIKWIAAAGLYRLRVNDYRIFYDSEGTILSVISVKHRKDAYS